ncbi:DUF6233 domain-containing protein [Streptomyces sp. NPDC001584]|uniref:DUF6233 domain-containing protein n=1 Tax=Streptomyces sp. NPDC001584 TaxID=3154521 RepID=UPI00331FBE85
MSEVQARLDSWRAVQAWLAWQQGQVERTIRGLEAELALERDRRPPPAPPDWKAEYIRTGAGPQLLRIHVGTCTMGSGKAIEREQARNLLADGVEPCPYCNPDNVPGMTG